MNKRVRKMITVALGLYLLAGNVTSVTIQAAIAESQPSTTRWIPPRPAYTEIMDWQSRERIEVKFAEGTGYRLRNGTITSMAGNDLSAIQTILNQYPLKSIERLFTQPEDEISADKKAVETASNQPMPDLNLWFRFTVNEGTDAGALIDALNALPEVEIAYPAMLPAPLPTPNYVSQQEYLNPATAGIDAKYAWTLAGGTGSKITVVDIEYSFNQSHEDLPTIPIIGGQLWNGYGDDHGTAVLGELAAKKNSYGVTGIVYDGSVRFSSACMSSSNCNYNPANAINTARTSTTKGDIILIEQQTWVCSTGKFGPLEWDQAVFDAILLATAGGRHVVEAAGNGNEDLDNAGCNNLFNRAFRDSGAFIVGAGAPPNYSQTDRSRLDFSSYGSRVDIQGWGRNVVTTGYGDLYTGTGKNQWYTTAFSGTSSASPIVAGSVALLSSIAEQMGSIKSPAWVRSTLVSTGSPQQDDPGFPVSQHIGPRPNLKKAIAKLGSGFNTSFNGNAPGWSVIRGSWSFVSSAYYKTAGISNKWSSIVYDSPSYTKLNYQARIKRTGCLDCGNGLTVRATVNPQKSNYRWYNGYLFQYTNDRFFSVQKTSPDGYTALKKWTEFSGINANGWNTLQVTASGSTLKFYINGSLVWTGSDSTLTSGKVGIMSYKYNDSDPNPDDFRVDWAKLSTTIATATDGELPAETGEEITDWTDHRVSPPRQ